MAWGHGGYGQTTVPVGLSGVRSIAAGRFHTVALKNDGTVVAWGWNSYGQTSVPAGLREVTSISAGDNHTVAARDDGTVIAWGWNSEGQTTVPSDLGPAIATAAGGYHTLALRSDGFVRGWGLDYYGQASSRGGATSIAAGAYHSVGLLRENGGRVMMWGSIPSGVGVPAAAARDVMAIAAGSYHTVALVADVGPRIASFSPTSAQAGASVVINGTNFFNVTAVRFADIGCSATVKSSTQITATVPDGFSSGLIQVLTQRGTATSATEFVLTTPFDAWRAEEFSLEQLADPAISGEQASPAHDGIANLMKYALALEPMVCGVDNLPTPGKQDGYLTLTYRQNKQAADITFTVESGESITGNDWQPATTELSRTDEGDYWLVTVQDNTPIADSPCRFMRLKVSR